MLKATRDVGSPSVASSRSDFLLATVSFQSQNLTQRALTCANRINLGDCISMNLSHQGTPPSIKMITQSMMALCAAIYIDCGRDIIRLKDALHHIDFIDNVDYANADMANCS
jgi:ribonuclease-3